MRPIGTLGKDERNRGGASASPLHIVAARVSKRKMQRRAEKKKVAARPAFVRVPSGSTCRGAHSPRRVPAPTWGRAGRASASVKRYPPAPQFRPGPRGKAARPAAAPRGGVLVSSGAARGLALSGPAGSAPRGRLRARPACPRLASVPLSVAVAPPAGLARCAWLRLFCRVPVSGCKGCGAALRRGPSSARRRKKGRNGRPHRADKIAPGLCLAASSCYISLWVIPSGMRGE